MEVVYDYAALTHIEIKDGKLKYIWHTLRKDTTLDSQRISSYDSYSTKITLTEEEKALIKNWIENHTIFDLPKEYEKKETPTYANLFSSALSVTLKDKTNNISWTGDSLGTEKLTIAIKELEDICRNIYLTRIEDQ